MTAFPSHSGRSPYDSLRGPCGLPRTCLAASLPTLPPCTLPHTLALRHGRQTPDSRPLHLPFPLLGMNALPPEIHRSHALTSFPSFFTCHLLNEGSLATVSKTTSLPPPTISPSSLPHTTLTLSTLLPALLLSVFFNYHLIHPVFCLFLP